jgi:hypothetical protein
MEEAHGEMTQADVNRHTEKRFTQEIDPDNFVVCCVGLEPAAQGEGSS